MKKSSPFILSALFLLIACNAEKSGGKGKPAPQEREERKPVVIDEVDVDIDIDANIEGQYLAIFEEVNPQITSKITGAFTFSREKETDELIADVRLTNTGREIIHAQYVRLGYRCPDINDDLNGDSVIDAAEGEAVYGKVYFPLDAELGSQASHDGVFPKSDEYGNYTWYNWRNKPEVIPPTKWSTFIKDLRSPDLNDGYFKLKDNEPMNIEGRVVVVHGVDAAMELPSTVGTVNRLIPQQTLPIACGVIKKVMTPPGTVNDGTYPAQTPPIEGELPEPEIVEVPEEVTPEIT